jgi:hypothetical protein
VQDDWGKTLPAAAALRPEKILHIAETLNRTRIKPTDLPSVIEEGSLV